MAANLDAGRATPDPKALDLLQAWIILFVHLVAAPAAVLHALITRRDPRASFGWIAVCILFPLGGPVAYLLFGVNRVRSRARHLGHQSFGRGVDRGDALHPDQEISEQDLQSTEPLGRIGARLSRHPMVAGNRVAPLYNGESAYPAMLEAIEGATRSVYLSTYIFDSDETGLKFMQALVRARQRGVEVKVLIDGAGELYSSPRARRLLARKGIEVAQFLPLRLFPPSLHINMRSHHKILVVDGSTAFTGGMNIGDRHLAENQANPSRVVDIQFRLEGPVVAQLQRVFADTWEFATGEVLDPPEPEPEITGGLLCRTITDGPDEDLDRLTFLFTAAISQAQESIRIMTPYFLPPREIIGALQSAVLRGVKVTLVLPEKNNLRFIHWATRNMLWELVLQGVEVHYQPPPFVHSKLLVIDRCYLVIGSSNWDMRSLRLNFELGVEICDSGLAGKMAGHIDHQAAAGRPVTIEELDGRSLPTRIRDSICWLFSPYL